ncbi:Transcriptional regulatory protein LiaR [bacterium HR23]|nr:Transcriptional regulatory protein LiaR [bacterium HR23]
MEEPLTLAVAIGSAVTREAVREALQKARGVRWVGEVSDWRQLPPLLKNTRPGVLLLSSYLPGLPTGPGLASFAREVAQVRVVIFFRPDTPPERVMELLALRPRAVVTTETSLADLLEVVELVARGLCVYPYTYMQRVASVHGPSPALPAEGGNLSPREQALLQLLAEGVSEKEIAIRLGIGQRTVHTYLERIRRKLGAVNRVHAVALATALQFITPRRPAAA